MAVHTWTLAIVVTGCVWVETRSVASKTKEEVKRRNYAIFRDDPAKGGLFVKINKIDFYLVKAKYMAADIDPSNSRMV